MASEPRRDLRYLLKTRSQRVVPLAGEVSSTGVGLDDLARRFRLTTGVAARWAESSGRFVVTLPLLPGP